MAKKWLDSKEGRSNVFVTNKQTDGHTHTQTESTTTNNRLLLGAEINNAIIVNDK